MRGCRLCVHFTVGTRRTALSYRVGHIYDMTWKYLTCSQKTTYIARLAYTRDNKNSSADEIPERDGRTDRRTDRCTVATTYDV